MNPDDDQEMAGQRLMVGFDGTDLNPDVKYLIDTLQVGGIILFQRNIVNPEQLKNLCVSVQEYAAACHQPPLLIAIDQEGGQVARLKKPFTQFPGNPFMKGKEDAERFARITASELKHVGINMNLAPVMDVAPEGIQSIMEQRVFGHTPEWVSDLGVAVIETLQNNEIIATAKHFPGIGRTTVDSHIDLPVLNTPAADLEAFDLIPFQAAIDNGVAAIMLSHIRYDAFDPEFPASLSVPIAKDLLRYRMGFDGLVITDDLDMGAIQKHYDIETSIRQILLAEIDMALICHKGPHIESAYEAILTHLKNSETLRAAGLKSLRRIRNAKKRLSTGTV